MAIYITWISKGELYWYYFIVGVLFHLSISTFLAS